MRRGTEKGFQARSNRTLNRVGIGLAAAGLIPSLYGWTTFATTESHYSEVRADCSLYAGSLPRECEALDSYGVAEVNELSLIVNGLKLSGIGLGLMGVAALRRRIGDDLPDAPRISDKAFQQELTALLDTAPPIE